MSRSGQPQLIVALLALTAALRIHGVWDDLPEVMASHFGAEGQPDRWLSRAAFFWILLSCSGITLLPLIWTSWIAWFPPHLVNVPYRDYWNTSERWPEAIARLKAYLHWFAVALALLLLMTIELTIRANLQKAPLDITTFLVVLCAFGLFTLGWCLAIWRAFRPD